LSNARKLLIMGTTDDSDALSHAKQEQLGLSFSYHRILITNYTLTFKNLLNLVVAIKILLQSFDLQCQQ
jgi:hypothetical protein